MVKRKHKRKAKAVKRKPVKRRKTGTRKKKVGAVKRKVTKKRKPVKPKQRAARKVVRQVERKSVERVMAGGRKHRRTRKRRVVMAGTPRRRSVGKSGGNKLLMCLAIGAAAIYFLTRPTGPTYPGTYPGTAYQLPPLTSTQNVTRNTQASSLLQYAIAGGLAIDAIIKLIDRLNTSSDQEVQNTYDTYHATGEIPGIQDYYV